MSSSRDSAEDLVVFARRGSLSESERRRLQEQFEHSFETRLLFEAGRVFDCEDPVSAGDEERVERMARRVLPNADFRSRVRRFRHVAQGAAVGAMLAGLAIAATDMLRAPKVRPALAPADTSAQIGKARAGAKARGVAEPAPPASVQLFPPASELAPSQKAPLARTGAEAVRSRHIGNGNQVAAQLDPPVSSGSSPSIAPLPELPASVAGFADVAPEAAKPGALMSNAPELFSAANRARRSGDPVTAIVLYQRLCNDFPKSSEAETAHLTLGVLYLQQQQPGAALEQFRICRAGGAGSSLVEALWGEAQALQRLGRAAEERATLARIVREFPGSAYVNAARKRLSDLP